MRTVRDTFEAVYNGGGSHRPHSAEYRQFGQDWGMEKVIFELAGEKLEKVAQVKQEYLTDAFTFLTYLIKKGIMEEKEEKYQQMIRNSKKR